MSERLGLSEVYVRKIERGTRNPGRETMLKFQCLIVCCFPIFFRSL
ncbi:helix-turn-helix domain-containing protein [Bacillus licheniformis]|nr:helix-turn-helix transcriptional regulator [Bacillus licheniformis]